MHNDNGCCEAEGGCCGEGCCCEEGCSVEDREAFLKEKEAILEAKLATVKHLMKSLGKKKETEKK